MFEQKTWLWLYWLSSEICACVLVYHGIHSLPGYKSVAKLCSIVKCKSLKSFEHVLLLFVNK